MATKSEDSTKNEKIFHKILVVDPRRCTGCEICESVCSFSHNEEFNPLNSRINRIRIEPIINNTLSCLSCYDPDCVKACQLLALSKDPETGLIHVDNNICDGCGACVRNCPFGAINVNVKERKAVVCDLCESTESGEPQCVEYCPKGAIFVEEIDPEINEDRLETLAKILKRGFPDPEPGNIYN
ncbi:4Fe-4S dicluster domain-containing protein [Promethearchaeum syntrophicum]|uniref:4Fe-4S dicluster domain-containing protein n=1 Tax=Promethearchaeum syntrophicum TaxID=2594042 RepID=A0A5B9DDV0_9ARCH|nr:4Fe-4S dicluster domain-containing protein [Candidatus Prometheoarchaeum syntrophicum]QEE16970.1 Hdr-like menaquinol oxidoreductase iron-sulfur subunit 1 precursor [Candidatus Prometheoarchaeum syntrophicum]